MDNDGLQDIGLEESNYRQRKLNILNLQSTAQIT